MNISNRYLRTSLAVLVTLLCLYLVGQLRDFFYDMWSVVKVLLIPFLASFIVMYILEPIVNVLVLRRVPRTMAILLIYAVFVLFLVIALMHAIPVISRQITQLVSSLPQLLQQADGWIDRLSARRQYLPEPLRRGLEATLADGERHLTTYFGSVLSMLTGTINAVLTALVVPFLVFYMLKDGRSIGRHMVRLSPEGRREQLRRIFIAVDQTLGRYVRGQLLVMLAVGILTYAGLLIIRMPYALLLALFLALADMIPFFGPFIGAAPALLLALSISPGMALKVLIVNIVVQQCEGTLISPQIMGRTLELHPMVIVASLLVGGEIGGILGMVVAVPFAAICKVVWHEIQAGKTAA